MRYYKGLEKPLVQTKKDWVWLVFYRIGKQFNNLELCPVK